MTSTATFSPITDWGRNFHGFLKRDELAAYDIAAVSLRCATDLPGTDNKLLRPCLEKVDAWTTLVERFTSHVRPQFDRDPSAFGNSEAQFHAIAMTDCFQRHLGVKYNFAFAEGAYDASDSRNLFLHGILTGFGGTCASLPVLFCAIGRRLGYPIGLAETKEHAFCRWDEPSGEGFCFDAAGRGCCIHAEAHYRKWPKQVSAKEEQINGFIRRMTQREELAFLAANRGACLIDNFRFVPAVEAFNLAHLLAPHKQSLHDGWGLAYYSAKIWQAATQGGTGLQNVNAVVALDLAAMGLRGPNVDRFRRPAFENIIRIINNRRRRDRASQHAAAIEEFTTTNLEGLSHV